MTIKKTTKDRDQIGKEEPKGPDSSEKEGLSAPAVLHLGGPLLHASRVLSVEM
jgi:hypothetical protein